MINKNIKISIIDYDIGNTASIYNALSFLGYEVKITDQVNELESSDLLILPGVGAFGFAMRSIEEKNLFNPLSKMILEDRKPIIGICLGMQLLGTESQESPGVKGFDFIPGKIKRIDSKDNRYSVPHVGWNNILFDGNSGIYQKIKMNDNFYFDHSYHFDCNKRYISSVFNYADEELVATVHKDNILGIQFHPEKSQVNGLKLFRGAIETMAKKC